MGMVVVLMTPIQRLFYAYWSPSFTLCYCVKMQDTQAAAKVHILLEEARLAHGNYASSSWRLL